MAELKMVASANTIAAINAAAQDDAGLIDQIRRGWPETAAEVATCLRLFHTFADELSVSCGLVTARCTLVQSAVLRSHVFCLSVCLSVCNVGEL